MKTMTRVKRRHVVRALLDYRACVSGLDALRRKLPLVDGGPHAPLACLGIGPGEIKRIIGDLQQAVGLNRRAAECLDRLGRALRPGETLLRVLQGQAD